MMRSDRSWHPNAERRRMMKAQHLAAQLECHIKSFLRTAYFDRLGLAFPPAVLRTTAARIIALNAPASISSPSRMSIARLVFPSRLELKSLAGSCNAAPLAKVRFTLSLQVSPVQMNPSRDHTGAPNIEFDGFLHITSSTTSGSASLMSSRILLKVAPRQSPRSAMLLSISADAVWLSIE